MKLTRVGADLAKIACGVDASDEGPMLVPATKLT
jgi:hypothetical protein